ncbi:Multidrug resistance-associated protein 1 [Acropora cervicornis]|uniref:ABC-type glutathione-S-conjugate transporter n=1 Tax=Acropora cervicornis TaxID=6130 RepID=A0AAD9UVT0_ACRCE|nr:Multidrug resistance-associated protein 1 [Acropora cervicornis]
MEESVGHFGYSASYAYLTASENFHSEEENYFQSSASKRQENHYVKRRANPQEKGNFLSKLTFWWLSRIIFFGYKRPLEEKDLWGLEERNQASHIVPKLKKIWSRQQENNMEHKDKRLEGHNNCSETDSLLGGYGESGRQNANSVPAKNEETKEEPNEDECKPSLLQTLWEGLFGKEFAMAVMCDLLNCFLVFLQPLLLRLLITYIEDHRHVDLFGAWTEWKGYVYCAALFVVAVGFSLVSQHRVQLMMTIGMRLQTALIGLVYEKALVLSNMARGKSTVGELVNLMSVDTLQIQQSLIFMNALWTGPLQVAGAMILLYQIMGLSAFAGVAVMTLTIPINFLVFARIATLQLGTTKNGQETSFLGLKQPSTCKESSQILGPQTLQTGNGVLVVLLQQVALTTFTVYTLNGHELTASKAFVAWTLFSLIRLQLTAFPDCIVGLLRLHYLLGDAMATKELKLLEIMTFSAVRIENGSFAWNAMNAPLLREISLSIPTGSLVAVVGQVGCGKSTLLSAILGETEKLQGKVFVEGSVAYVAQQAWIQNATVRDNILFGEAFDSVSYDNVINSCALKKDLEMLPVGDMTVIGQRGINLSGGQKQRVSLARAVYFDADLYLLDDPLSAVDVHVGKHIFDNVIGPEGMLRKKTRILVTHTLQILPQMDQIIILKDGRISESGTYNELLEHSGAFAEFLENYPSKECLQKSSVSENPIRSPQSSDSESGRPASLTEVDDEIGKTIDDENMETGMVKFSVFNSYLRSIGVCAIIFTVIFLLLTEISHVTAGFWLASWSAANITSHKQRDFYIGVYGGIGFGHGLFNFLLVVTLCLGSMAASRRLHHKLLVNIIHSPMNFFNTTPLGRIVNRLSKDIYVIDEALNAALLFFLLCLSDALGTIVAISCITPLFLTVLPIFAALYFYIQRVYVPTSRQLRRIASVTRSPIYSHFLETLHGTATIRAFSQQQRFIRDNYDKTDKSQEAQYLAISAKTWLGIRIEFIGSCLVFFAAIFAVTCRDKITSGLAGMSLTYSLQITGILNLLVRMASLLETDLVSVERVKEFSETPTEGVRVKTNSRPPDNWPESGSIVIQELDLRYRKGLPTVLKQINCGIKAGEKIGIVGRTGAGKSSLALALFRILEKAGGRILVDGVDIANIGLHDLRSRLAIIPQDFVSGLSKGLDHQVTEGGENLSVGQQQLVCLARALLRKSKILVLDEATAAVDLETDDLIQQTIRREFADRTVLTIAHRLNTIMDYDRY